MFNTKTRTAIIATAAVAALALPSAASALGRPGATPQIIAKPTTAVPLKEAFSAGVPGWSNKKCAGVLDEYNRATEKSEAAYEAGNKSEALGTAQLAGEILSELEDHCVTVD
jgi:hypothetical protein